MAAHVSACFSKTTKREGLLARRALHSCNVMHGHVRVIMYIRSILPYSVSWNQSQVPPTSKRRACIPTGGDHGPHFRAYVLRQVMKYKTGKLTEESKKGQISHNEGLLLSEPRNEKLPPCQELQGGCSQRRAQQHKGPETRRSLM